MSDEKIKLRSDLDSDARRILDNADRVAERVAHWPSWKRGASFIVQLTCCGRTNGTYGPAAWTEADDFRESYLSGPAVDRNGHLRSAIIKAAP